MLDTNLLQLLRIRDIGLLQLLHVGYRSSATVICLSIAAVMVYERYSAIATYDSFEIYCRALPTVMKNRNQGSLSIKFWLLW